MKTLLQHINENLQIVNENSAIKPLTSYNKAAMHKDIFLELVDVETKDLTEYSYETAHKLIDEFVSTGNCSDEKFKRFIEFSIDEANATTKAAIKKASTNILKIVFKKKTI